MKVSATLLSIFVFSQRSCPSAGKLLAKYAKYSTKNKQSLLDQFRGTSNANPLFSHDRFERQIVQFCLIDNLNEQALSDLKKKPSKAQ
jgi:hypothetical protein